MARLSIGRLGERRSLGTEAGKWKRLARRAREEGYGRAAQEAYMKHMELKAQTPSVIRQEYRQAQEGMAAAEEARQAQMQAAFLKFMGMYNRPQPDYTRGDYGGRAPIREPYYPPIDKKAGPYYNPAVMQPEQVPSIYHRPKQFEQKLPFRGLQGARGL